MVVETLGVASSVAGCVSLGITVCQGLLDYYGSWIDAERDVRRMYDSIEALTKIFILLKLSIANKKFDRNVVARVQESIATCEPEIGSLNKELNKIKITASKDEWREIAKAQFRRTLYPFKKSTLRKLKEISNDLLDNLSLALNALQIDASAAALERLDSLRGQITAVSTGVDHLTRQAITASTGVKGLKGSLARASTGVDTLVSAHSDEYLVKVYNWLSALAGEFENKQLDTFNLENRQDGIGEWLLKTNEYKDWINGSGKTLWCLGMRDTDGFKAGVGKTVLSSFVINHLEQTFKNTNIGIAYIYCNYKESEKLSPANLIASLLHQLVLRKSILRGELTALYEAHIHKKTRPPLSECSKLLQIATGFFAKVLIIIDALDECPEEVTSRHVLNIDCELQDAVRLEIRARGEDVTRYLEGRVSRSTQIQRFVKKDANLRGAIVGAILNKFARFLLARLHVDALMTKTSLRDIKRALNALPEGLGATYDESMKRIQTQNAEYTALAKKVLYWIIYAVRPLTTTEIRHALAVEPDDTYLDGDGLPDEDLLVSVCAGLVTIQPESDTMSLIHYTTQEYFERRGAKLFPDAQTEIATSCLTYLLFNVFEEGYSPGDDEMEKRLQENPLLRYAAQHWGNHVRGGPEKTAEVLILKFLGQDSKVSCSVQAMLIPEYQYNGYSQRSPKVVHGLSVAAYFGLKDIIRLLLRQGADVAAKDGDGWTALHVAARQGHEEVVQLLLEQGADVETKNGVKWTSLHVAAGRGYEPAMRLLLEQRTDVAAKDRYGWTALHLAADRGHKTVVRLLLREGADVAAKDGYGKTALHLAASRGHEEVVRLLTPTILES